MVYVTLCSVLIRIIIKFGRILKDSEVVLFKVLSLYVRGEAAKTHENPLICPRLNPAEYMSETSAIEPTIMCRT